MCALSMLRFAPFLLLACASAQPISILVSGGVLSETESRFASWNIDPSCNRGFNYINFSNPNLVAAAAALSPSRLRFGGSGADDLLYSFTSDGVCDGLPPPGSPGDCHYVTAGCLNASHFSSLLGLLASNAPGAAFENQFIFGLSFNISEASAGLPWNAANAQRLLTHLQWPSDAVWGFELGNEVNNAGTVKPEQQAAAVLTLSRMLGPTGRVRYPPPAPPPHTPRRTPTPALDHPLPRTPAPTTDCWARLGVPRSAGVGHRLPAPRQGWRRKPPRGDAPRVPFPHATRLYHLHRGPCQQAGLAAG